MKKFPISIILFCAFNLYTNINAAQNNEPQPKEVSVVIFTTYLEEEIGAPPTKVIAHTFKSDKQLSEVITFFEEISDIKDRVAAIISIKEDKNEDIVLYAGECTDIFQENGFTEFKDKYNNNNITIEKYLASVDKTNVAKENKIDPKDYLLKESDINDLLEEYDNNIGKRFSNENELDPLITDSLKDLANKEKGKNPSQKNQNEEKQEDNTSNSSHKVPTLIDRILDNEDEKTPIYRNWRFYVILIIVSAIIIGINLFAYSLYNFKKNKNKKEGDDDNEKNKSKNKKEERRKKEKERKQRTSKKRNSKR